MRVDGHVCEMIADDIVFSRIMDRGFMQHYQLSNDSELKGEKYLPELWACGQ